MIEFIYSINLQIYQGSLVALVGMVGSGKSSILAALLGEMIKVNGRVSISGKIAYVPQTAWIMNTTLKENILFGRDFDKKLYDQVIEACALKQDLRKKHFQEKFKKILKLFS
jgi:ABC-type transport system involved in cytochrome bd biosynthesis fused ATPase/permease subunit